MKLYKNFGRHTTGPAAGSKTGPSGFAAGSWPSENDGS